MSIVGLFIMLFCFIFHLIDLIGNLELDVVGTLIIAAGCRYQPTSRHLSDLYQPPNKVAVSDDPYGCGLDLSCSLLVCNESRSPFSFKMMNL